MARILVVDDDSQAIEQISRLLVDAGHTPDFLLESQFLLPKLEAALPDLILLDINMPEIDGITLLRQLKLRESMKQTPVIMVTGDTEEKIVSRCFALGAADFVNKPLRPLELRSRIDIALATRAHIQAIEQQKSDLARSKALIETILNSMEDAICVLDSATFTIVEANQVFLQLVNLPREKVIGRLCHEKVTAQSHPCLFCHSPKEPSCILGETVKKGGSVAREWVHHNARGEKLHTRVITTPIPSDGEHSERVVYLARDITAAKQAEERLMHLAFHDTLTGLPNRQLFFDRLEQALAQGRRHKELVAVMYFDLDRFKEINDTLGHEAGDLLLKQVAGRLLSCVRASDTVARLGGDEFTAVLTNIGELSDVQHLTQKMLGALGREYRLWKESVSVTTSIGVSLFPFDGGDQKTLTRRADKALYKAKAEGRNNAKFWSSSMADS
ncbi:MAG: diguanylate cyclase [Magnetococcales bacterium]|nr:diguanylate cyclase [Magnetococcales bacterium]MBF0157117.1 diguanylate cyclase [Magnetococcales bacterium]